MYTVARARGGVSRTSGITMKDLPATPADLVMPEVRRTCGLVEPRDAPPPAAPAEIRNLWITFNCVTISQHWWQNWDVAGIDVHSPLTFE